MLFRAYEFGGRVEGVWATDDSEAITEAVSVIERDGGSREGLPRSAGCRLLRRYGHDDGGLSDPTHQPSGMRHNNHCSRRHTALPRASSLRSSRLNFTVRPANKGQVYDHHLTRRGLVELLQEQDGGAASNRCVAALASSPLSIHQGRSVPIHDFRANYEVRGRT